MKKILALMLALCMVFALAACGEPASEPSDAPVSDAPEASEAPASEAPETETPTDAEGGLTILQPGESVRYHVDVSMIAGRDQWNAVCGKA